MGNKSKQRSDKRPWKSVRDTINANLPRAFGGPQRAKRGALPSPLRVLAPPPPPGPRFYAAHCNQTPQPWQRVAAKVKERAKARGEKWAA